MSIRLWVSLLVAVLVAPAVAQANPSAFPLKAAGDSGQVALPDFDPEGFDGPDWVRGFDACTYTQPYDNFTLVFQQYQVAGCVPIQTPWVEVPPIGIVSWTLYCPASAPNSWVDSLGGTLQQWTTSQYVSGLTEGPGQFNTTGPSPPAVSDYSSINGTSSDQWWLYLVACSPQVWNDVGDGGTYCCGQGVSAIPFFRPPPTASETRRRAQALRPRLVKGPARRRHRTSPNHYTETREVDLRPGTTRTYYTSCDAGYALAGAHSAVGWYTRRPPRAADGHVESEDRIEGRRYAVTTTASANVRPGAARVQTRIACSRHGDPGPPRIVRLPIR